MSHSPTDLLALEPAERSRAICAWGTELGFDQVGVAPPGPFPEMQRFAEWLERGYHGTMQYMVRHRRRRENPERALRNLGGVIVAALGYDTPQPRTREQPADPERGWISRYAWGQDYHEVLEPRLDAWVERLNAAAPGHRFLRYVDHGPVLEKVFARYAGLGWVGKHTNLIHPRRGSYFFLATILSDLSLAPTAEAPMVDHCGSCTACLDVCPTQAFPQPYVLDARRCISYLTIETKAPVPADLEPALGEHLFGCDLCQDVCPWNRKPVPPDREVFRPRPGAFQPALDELLALDEAGFAARFAGSPVQRAGLQRLREGAERAKRNASSGGL